MRIMLIASESASLVNFRGPLIQLLVAKGHTVFAAGPNMTPTQVEDIQKLGARTFDVSLQRTGMNPIKDVKFLLTAYRCIRALKVDLVVTYTIKPNIWGGLAAGLARVPSISMVTGLGFAFTQPKTQSGKVKVLRRMITLLFRLSTSFNKRVVFQNPDDRDAFIAAGCLANSGKVRLVNGSGVDMDHYKPVPLPDAPVFLMIARLLKNKGVQEYAEAAAALKKHAPSARCMLVGGFDPGPDSIDEQDLQRWIENGLDYRGELSDVRPALAEASVFVLPSYREGTPRSVLEAMSMGRAIITTDVPGCRETVQHGVTGYLCTPQSSTAIFEAMCALCNVSEKRARMGQASHEMARAKYDVHKVNAVLLDHFDLQADIHQS